MKPYKDTRIALEKKSEEFKNAGNVLMALDNPHCNSAVGRYYYAIYIRIMQLTRVLNKVKNIGDKKDSHRYTIRMFNKTLQQDIIPKMIKKDVQEKALLLVGRLEKCSDYRLKADYKDDFLQVNNVNYLKKTLDIFDEIYDEILEIMDVESNEE